jgi:hypothetical protein
MKLKKTKDTYRTVVGKLEGNRQLEKTNILSKIILKLTLKK